MLDFATLTTGFSGTALAILAVIAFQMKTANTKLDSNIRLTNKIANRMNHVLGKLGLEPLDGDQ